MSLKGERYILVLGEDQRNSSVEFYQFLKNYFYLVSS